MREVFKSSQEASLLGERKVGFTKYPWRTMEVGTSFHVERGEASFGTISNSCYKMSRKLHKKFRAIDHGDSGIEVARLPDPPLKQTAESVGKALVNKLPEEYKEKGAPQFWGDKANPKKEKDKE